MVLNDAGVELSEGAREALVRGLSFAPSERRDPERLGTDLERLRRTINLRLHWNRMGVTGGRRSLISTILRSGWNPPELLRTDHPAWSTLLTEAGKILDSRRTKQNLPRGCLQEWRKLLADERIYILKADKGGKTVIWSREEYRREATRILEDQDTYLELTSEQATKEYADLRQDKEGIIRRLLRCGSITSAEATRIRGEKTDIPAFYILPKIHKEKKNGTFPGRPITAAVGGMLKTLDVYLAEITAILLKLIPGSLQDTADLIRALQNICDLPPGAILFSADVESLYPSIPWAEGIAGATEFYTRNLDVLRKAAEDENRLPPPPPDVFKDLLTLILEKNIFHFQGQRWFRQKRGTAMGCSMSVFLANTFMHSRTKHLLDNPPDGLRCLLRYIDDLVGVWVGPKESIPAIFKDTTDSNIRLTYVVGGATLEALDLRLHLEQDGTVSTSLFRKPTDGHQYVLWSSAHPKNLKASIPYAQLLRIRRNCSKEEDYRVEADTLLDRFRKRGYPDDILQAAATKAATTRRENLLNPGRNRTKPEERLTAVIDNGEEDNQDIARAIRRFYRTLKDDPLVKEQAEIVGDPLPDAPPRLATRIGRTLGSWTGPVYKAKPRPSRENPT
jgi:hypothetical protein